MTVKGTLTIRTTKREDSPGDLLGMFFEDLNHAADSESEGNRSCAFDPIDPLHVHTLTAWEKVECEDGHQDFDLAKKHARKLFLQHQGDYELQVIAQGFEKPFKQEMRSIEGMIAIATDQGAAEFSRIHLIDHATGEIQALGAEHTVLFDTEQTRANGKSRRMLELKAIASEHYTLSLIARRIEGSKGVFIHFGRRDDQNQIIWEIGGRKNQDSLISAFVEGRSSVLIQSLFTVETNVDYHLVLVVHGRTIRAYINGILVAETEYRTAVIESLYYSSSIEEVTGDIILKVVNVQGKEAAAAVRLEDLELTLLHIEAAQLSWHGLREENICEEPERIVPAYTEFDSQGSTFEYMFPSRSVTVLRMKSHSAAKFC
ncbi:hypothetical protein H8B09_23585 [Paenibacillus sp. PR3]|uniref:Uncharacterized protein n=1 Tax=Paenibacillus terricola TaxID=2763503 RepID=A0ABR8N3G8_9BACL|nr:hypothetical protein [Paenibacillus terricola]MBD3921765.1 hypothetical protein [Paenibacillus terricola]